MVKTGARKTELLKILWMMYVMFPFRLEGLLSLQYLLYYSIAGIFLLIFLFRCYNAKIDKDGLRYVYVFAGLFALLMLLSLIVPEVRRTDDFSYFNYYVYYVGRLLILTGTIGLCNSLREYIRLHIRATSLYVVFSIILLIPPLHTGYLSILHIENRDPSIMADLYSSAYYTRFGLQGFSGFGDSFKCAISVMLCCYMLAEDIDELRSVGRILMWMAVNLLGCFFYGRIGVLASGACIIFTVLYIAFRMKRYKVLYFALAVAALGLLAFVLLMDQLMKIRSLRWMLEGFANLLRTGRLETSSSRRLSEMYFMPGLRTFLLGDGRYMENGHYYMRTDVGFLRPLLFWGIGGEIVYYGTIVPLLIPIKRQLKGHGTFFVILCALLLIVFELKGEENMDMVSTLFTFSGSALAAGKLRCWGWSRNVRPDDGIRRYVFVTDQFRTGGVETVFLNIANQVDELLMLLPVHSSFESDLIERLPSNVELLKTGGKFGRSALDVIRLLYAGVRMMKDRRLEGAVVINFSDTLSSLLITFLLGGQNSISWFHCNPRALLNSKTNRVYFFLLRLCSELVFICRDQQNLFFSLKESRNISRNKASICMNSVDLNVIWERMMEPVEFSEQYFLMVARMDVRSKDFVTLLDAYAGLPGKIREKYRLLLVGDGPDREQVEAMTRERALLDRVVFTGNISNPYKLMKNAEIYIHSSRSEGFSMVLVEALACGCNVVSADCEVGPREILQSGKYGKLYEPGNSSQLTDAILAALDSGADGKDAVERAEQIASEGYMQIRSFFARYE